MAICGWKWLRVLRGRWSRMNPRGCGRAARPEEGTARAPVGGRGQGPLLTGGGLLAFSSSARVPTVEFAASDYCCSRGQPSAGPGSVSACVPGS